MMKTSIIRYVMKYIFIIYIYDAVGVMLFSIKLVKLSIVWSRMTLTPYVSQHSKYSLCPRKNAIVGPGTWTNAAGEIIKMPLRTSEVAAW
jgi:hypothetical protein